MGVIGAVGQQGLMGSDDALGFSGGARGEHDVGALPGVYRRGPVVGFRFGVDGCQQRFIDDDGVSARADLPLDLGHPLVGHGRIEGTIIPPALSTASIATT